MNFISGISGRIYNSAIGSTHSRITIKLIVIGLLFSGCFDTSDHQWHEESHHRWKKLSPGWWGGTGFDALSADHSGITFENNLSRQKIGENRHYLNGSGVAAADIDADGLTDLYFTGLESGNRLYKNTGNLQFVDITEQAGVAHEHYFSTGAVFSDVNGDFHPDLLVTAMHKQNELYINNGDGTFYLEKNSGLGESKGSMSMALADIDSDGDLDLYIANYKEKSVKDIYTSEELKLDNMFAKSEDGYSLMSPYDKHHKVFYNDKNQPIGVAESGETDELYFNEGGRFRKAKDLGKIFLDEGGNTLGLQKDWGLTAKFQDLNNDHLPDLYVSNDFYSKDRVWINQGNGTFRASPWYAIRNQSYSSMAVDFSDINRDGLRDIFVTEMLSPEHNRRLRQAGAIDPVPKIMGETKNRPQYNRNTMLLKREDNTYAEITYLSGTEATGWSWSTRFMDVNLDGFEDIIVTTGYLYDILDIDAQVAMMQKRRNMDEHFLEFVDGAPDLKLRNKILANNGNLTFQNKGREWGFEEKDVAHGMAAADLDNDGDLELAVNRMNNTALVYENTTTASRILISLIGDKPNTSGIGATVTLISGGEKQVEEISEGGDYLSDSAPAAMFAAKEGKEYTIQVEWPDGGYSKIDRVRANRMYEIHESGAVRPDRDGEEEHSAPKPLFKDISEAVNHKHHESSFDDTKFQPMLPLKLSELGPSISWIDLEGDGDDDLIVGSGKGGALGGFENIGNNRFQKIDTELFTRKAVGDQTAVLAWNISQGTELLIGSANLEQGDPRVPAVFKHSLNGLTSIEKDSLSGRFTTGPMAVADYDGDGDLDLFVGGRFFPGHYPRDVSSQLFINDNGQFVLDQTNEQVFTEIGLITAAVFSDYDRDGDPDLFLSRAWDSIVLMENENGEFRDVSDKAGLSSYKGWWNGITTADFNNDGYADVAATNWGKNSFYKLRNGKPLRMYYKDLNGDKWQDILMTHADKNGNYVPMHRLYNYRNIPAIAGKYRSYGAFADATVDDIFGDQLEQIPYKEINTVEHMVFINSEGTFKAEPLPIEAQFAVAFHPGAADVDNDGNMDLFLSQNFFGMLHDVPRSDAGRGLLLEGDGNATFRVVPGSKSGIKMYGEQRGAAFSDFNKDGKIDLAVTQNGGKTRLFENQTSDRGYRIILNGSEKNRNGIGSTVQLVYIDGQKGPAVEIQSGAGYWSQDSYIKILGAQKEAAEIKISWFDGTTQNIEILPDKYTYTIHYPSGSE